VIDRAREKLDGHREEIGHIRPSTAAIPGLDAQDSRRGYLKIGEENQLVILSYPR
jgi:hypothetical protein